MNSTVRVCLIALGTACMALAQGSAKPPLQRGIRVEMASAAHAVQMPAADEKGAIVVGVTADGKVFLGAKPVEISSLSSLNEGTVYVKADARAQYQKVLAVLDALHGRSVVLLTAPASSNAEKGKIVPPYGVKVTLGE